MKIVVTGGEGFIGQALVSRLRRGAAIDGRPASQITVLDQRIAQRLPDERLRYIEGDFSDRALLERAIEGGVDCVFHLASIPGGAAEQNFELGMKVNLHATLELLEVLRRAGGAPKLVFASSIGIYGVPMPRVIDENTIPLPSLSYGAQKLIGEYLVADYGRRGFVDGRSVRIPGIVARPPSKGMLSLFLSDLIRELSAGRHFVCPVAPEGMSWFMSRPAIVDNLLHAAHLGPEQLSQQRTWLLPVLHVSISGIVAAIARLHGKQILSRVTYEPNAALQAQFANYPPLLCPKSQAAGFRHDGTVENLVTRALEPI
jgi:nucleoside-diphosphate-sugar epimerase